MARLHTSGINRSWNTALAYYCWSTAVVCFSVALLILLAEFGTRLYYRDVLSASGVNYFSNKSAQLYADERNTLKLRGKQFRIGKHDNYRIAVLGDSITYAQGVYPYTLRFTDLVEKKLKTLFPKTGIEVINLGIAGHNLPQHIRYLHFVRALHPDFVLYQWFINDMDIAGKRSETVAPRLISSDYWHLKLTNKSALYFIVQRGWEQWHRARGNIKSYDRYIGDLYGDDNAVFAKQSTARLIELLDGIKNIGVPYGVVLFPHSGFPIKANPFDFMHERVMAICEKRNLPCLDLREAYASFDDRLENLWANRFDRHPNAMAHGIAAGKIFDFFAPSWRKQIAERQPLNR